MKSFSRIAGALAVGCALATLGGQQASAAGKCENPDVLTFSIIPTEETIQELTLYKPVVDYLSAQTGKKIEFYMPTSYASVVEAMLGGWVDVAVHGPYSYVIANTKDPDIEVFATYAKRPGHLQEEGPGYKAALVSKKGSKFTTIESLKGAVIGLTDPASTSGNLVPRVVFTKVIGQDLEDCTVSTTSSTGAWSSSRTSTCCGRRRRSRRIPSPIACRCARTCAKRSPTPS
jgi:phosphonate transport system substrate-binding protein